jgi:site-specific DNA-methyltransferase (adenine-specific)
VATKLNRVIHGDCIQELKKLRAGSIDLVFADPPFNIGYDYDEYDDKRSCNDYLDWSKRWIGEVVRVLKPDGTFWLAIGDEYAAELKVAATRELGFTCRSWVVWYYTFGVHCNNKFTRSHAHLFHFVKDPKKFTFNDMAVRVPSARQLVYGDKRANPKGRVPDDTWLIRPTPQESWILRPQDLPEGFEGDSDTWYFSRVCGTFRERKGFHGCQMPEQLLGRIIKACSNEGEIVLDPFTGSGTTLAVARKLNRRYLGFEISEQYVKETKSRLRRVKPGHPLDGPENPLTSAPNTANGTIRTQDGRRVKRNGPAKRRGRPRKVDIEQPELWS